MCQWKKLSLLYDKPSIKRLIIGMETKFLDVSTKIPRYGKTGLSVMIIRSTIWNIKQLISGSESKGTPRSYRKSFRLVIKSYKLTQCFQCMADPKICIPRNGNLYQVLKIVESLLDFCKILAMRPLIVPHPQTSMRQVYKFHPFLASA